MANNDNWWENPDGPGGNPNDNTGWTPDDPYNQAPQPPGGGGGGGGCGPGTFEIDIDGEGNPFPPGATRDCVDQAEASRRNKLWIAKNPGNTKSDTGKPPASADPFPGTSAPKYNIAKAPMFTAPQFQWNETFQAPDYNSLASDPGYQFRVKQALGAMQSSAAAKGFLRTGATVKDLGNYASDYASQELGNLFNRSLSSYNTRFGTAKDVFDRYYTGKKDEFAPKYSEWQTLTAAEQHAKDLAWKAALDKWYNDNLSAADIYRSGGQ